MTPLTPELTVSPSTTHIETGSEVTFTCVTQSTTSGSITYQWYKDDVLITGSSTSSDETYTIPSAALSDSDPSYTCTATIDGVDSSASNKVPLNIRGKFYEKIPN